METKINWANDYVINESLKEIGTSTIATAIRIMSNLDELKDEELYNKLDKEIKDVQNFLNSEKYYATEEEANKAVDELAKKFKELDALEDKILSERGV
jgi:uracil phosphoribosyltransferase